MDNNAIRSAVETLESRQLMAAMVFVTTLPFSNEQQINVQFDATRQNAQINLVVVNVVDKDGDPTTFTKIEINDQRSGYEAYSFDFAARAVQVDMGAGNDRASIKTMGNFSNGVNQALWLELHGGAGNDRLTNATSGDDVYYDGGVVLYGPVGLRGGAGNDMLFGNDSISAPDLLDGGEGNDLVIAGAGNDIIVFGGNGSDSLFGGDGDDQFMLDQPGRGMNYIFGGSGRDTLSYSVDAGYPTLNSALRRVRLFSVEAILPARG